MIKKISIISQLLKSLIVEDYAKAVDIITSDKFNPNDTNKSWNAPVLSAIIIVISELNKVTDQHSFKTILKEITKHEKFDPNVTDAEGETILMHIARHADFNWLAPFVLTAKNVDINIRNFMHKDAIDVALQCKNNALADVLLAYKGRMMQHKGLPKKHAGIKKKKANKNHDLIKRLENAFSNETKLNPVSLYNLLVNFFDGEYDQCIQIVKDVNFNPNEYDRWEEPVLTSLIYYSQDTNIDYDEDKFKQIVKEIISLPRFNVNSLDSDCNTPLMVSMGFPKLKWMTEMLFKINSARIDVINDSGETIRDIARNCGNEEFYNHLIRKTFETANVVS